MYNISSEIKLKAVEEYLKNGKSLRSVAKLFNVNYRSVYKWVKIYKEGGEENLLGLYRRPWNRVSPEVERRIILLKEENPSISLRKTKEVLKEYGIRISIRGIWNVWKRYGYAGLRKFTNDFTECYEWTREAKYKYRIAKEYFEKNDIKRCAKILNEIPFLPRNEILSKIPDRYLNIWRRVEKVAHLFGEANLDEYIERVDKILKILEKKRLYYSLLRVTNFYLISLEWKGRFKKIIEEVNRIKKMLDSNKSLFIFRWTILISEGIALANLLNIKEAKKIAKYCESMLKRRGYNLPHFEFDLGILWFVLDNYRKAERYYLRSLRGVEEEFKKKIKGEIFRIHIFKGKPEGIREFKKGVEIGEWGEDAFYLYFMGFMSLLKGEIHKAFEFAKTSLSLLKERKLKTHIFLLYLLMAGIYSAINERNKGVNMLKSIIKFLEKNGLKKYALLSKILTSPSHLDIGEFIHLPPFKLFYLIKNKKLKEAYMYAEKNYILTYFYIYLLLLKESFSESDVRKLNLQKRFLKLPAFSEYRYAFELKFLGDLRVYRLKGNKKRYLKMNLLPKEKTILIHLALRAGEPGKRIELDNLFTNFWRESENPSKNLSKVIFKIRKELKIPSNFIEINKKENSLINNGIYFITDYSEFENTIAQVKAFLSSGELEMAKKFFLKALKILKKIPFEKMYDTWSEDLRARILNIYYEYYEKFKKLGLSMPESFSKMFLF